LLNKPVNENRKIEMSLSFNQEQPFIPHRALLTTLTSFLVFQSIDMHENRHRFFILAKQRESPCYLTSSMCVTKVLVRSLRHVPSCGDETAAVNRATVCVWTLSAYYCFLLSLLPLLATPSSSSPSMTVVVQECTCVFFAVRLG
jgi:hypothetical protein